MYNIKNLSILGLFGIIIVFVLVVATSRHRQSEQDQEGNYIKQAERAVFKNVKYYKTAEKKPQMKLDSEYLEIVDNTYLSFEKPNGVAFNDGKQIGYQADKGNLDQLAGVLVLEGSVVVSGPNSDYATGRLIYNQKENILSAFDGVSSQLVDSKTLDIIKMKSKEMRNEINNNYLTLNGEVVGELIRKRSYEGKLEFEASELSFNSLESLLKLTKAVKIRRNNYDLSAGSAEIFLENFNKKLKYYVLYDDVKLEEEFLLRSGKRQKRRAFAEKLEGHQRTGKIVLTGAPRVEQGTDLIKGYQITLRENVELVEVDDAQSSFDLKRNKNE